MVKISVAPPVLLPDLAIKQEQGTYQPIDWVGMEGIQIPLVWEFKGSIFNLMAKIEVMVSLDLSPSRGIHMSRLYSLVQSLGQTPITMESLKLVSEKLTTSQNTQSMLSSASRLKISFDLPLQRKSLKSELLSWRVYPVSLLLEHRQLEQRQNFPEKTLVDFKFLYSSTCPASAALARDLNSQHFAVSFKDGRETAGVQVAQAAEFLQAESGVIATPHAQRSEAHVQLLVNEDFEFSQIADYITLLETALGTPVQGAVKREDEQEFGRLNGTHLMFCEDAVRTLARTLNLQKNVVGYRLHVIHFESLHSHDAASIIQKNFSFAV